MSDDQSILNLYAGQLKSLAKEDYISARALYITFNLRPARVMALQALEKLAKAICLMNGVQTRARGHDVAKIYMEQLLSLGVALDEECSKFILSVGNGYNSIRYEMEPISFCRSEVWLVDRCFFKFLRYSHWYRPNGKLSPNSNPLDREFGDILKGGKIEDKARRDCLVAESIIDGKPAAQVLKDFIEYNLHNNTFWDSYPNDQLKIFEVLNRHVVGFGDLKKNPEAYDDKNVVTGIIDPSYGTHGALNLPFAPLSVRSSGGSVRNTVPEWSTYFDEIVYVDL